MGGATTSKRVVLLCPIGKRLEAIRTLLAIEDLDGEIAGVHSAGGIIWTLVLGVGSGRLQAWTKTGRCHGDSLDIIGHRVCALCPTVMAFLSGRTLLLWAVSRGPKRKCGEYYLKYLAFRAIKMRALKVGS